MKRSPISRTGILGQQSHARLAAGEPKRRSRKCAICRSSFEPRSMGHKVCGPDCAQALVKRDNTAKDRKALRDLKAQTKTKGKHIAELQDLFNLYIRTRDANKPCIDCGRFHDGAGSPGGDWDAGHYLSRGHAPHLRFDERNVHRQLKGCNRPGGTTRIAFRAGMERRIGLEALLALESDVMPRQYSIPDLVAMKIHYKQKIKELQA